MDMKTIFEHYLPLLSRHKLSLKKEINVFAALKVLHVLVSCNKKQRICCCAFCTVWMYSNHSSCALLTIFKNVDDNVSPNSLNMSFILSTS